MKPLTGEESIFQTPARAPENSRRHATSISHRLRSSTPYPPAGILPPGGRGSARLPLFAASEQGGVLPFALRARCVLGVLRGV